ncbi:MAG: SUMF1/EgtB/PvdO family nonheme iron enzyme [Bacteroidota bacterium]
MKKILIILCFLGYGMSAHALSRPEVIPSKLTEIKARGWYEEKLRAWQEFLLENPDDQAGWLEYFRAAHYAQAEPALLKRISNQIETQFNDSYESHYAQALQLGWSDEGLEALKTAVEVAPDQNAVIPDRLMLAEFELDRTERQALGQSLYEKQLIYPSLLNYSYNVLMSVGEDGVLVVEGEHTTVPVWMLQDVMGVRPDVKVLNLDLAENTNYLTQWSEQNGLKGVDRLATPFNRTTLSRSLPLLNPEVAFYYALTLPSEHLSNIQDRLYVVGLTSYLNGNSFDNYSALKENVEQKFLMDYLTVDFNGEPKTATGKVYETNYIVPFLLMKEYYDQLGDDVKVEEWEGQLLRIADRSQLKTRLQMLINDRTTVKKFVPADYDFKKLDHKMKKVKDNLYASEVEVTTEDYKAFIDYLEAQGHTDLLSKARIDISGFDEITTTWLKTYLFTHVERPKDKKSKQKSYADYPVMNIPFEGAKIYCEWLTEQYNAQEGREYKRVQFRLPTRKEWTMAALGFKGFTSWNLEENTVEANAEPGKSKTLKKYPLKDYKILYPWWQWGFEYRDQIQNTKDCYLANVKTPAEKVCPHGAAIGDGFTFTSPVASYFANKMGLYDVVGNVAEMTDQEGKAMGGSWNHPAEESTITSINNYEGPDTAVGFRLFMEVIEE